MYSSRIVVDAGVAASGELVAAAEAICAELASREAPECGAASKDLAERLAGVTDSCEAAIAGLVRRTEASGEHLRWGHNSAAGWLTASCGMRAGRARLRVTVSRQLPRLPLAAKRFAAGDLSLDYVATICEAVASLGDEDCAIAETALLGLIDEQHLTPQQLARAGARIHDIIDTRDGAERPDEDTRRGHRRSWLRISDALDGGAFLKGYADAELKSLLRAALEPLARPQGEHDDRDHAQRMAEALKTLLSGGGRNWTATLIINLQAEAEAEAEAGAGASTAGVVTRDEGAGPAPAGQPGSVAESPGPMESDPASPEAACGSGRPERPGDRGRSVAAGNGDRRGIAGCGSRGFTARLPEGTPIPPWRARQIALNAGISALILSSQSLPLYLGRTVRLATPAQRKVLDALYETCADRDCDIPAWLCEADHVEPWYPAGRTDVDKLAPVCGWLNRFKHEHPDQVRVARRPDGRWEYTITGPGGRPRRHKDRQAQGP